MRPMFLFEGYDYVVGNVFLRFGLCEVINGQISSPLIGCYTICG